MDPYEIERRSMEIIASELQVPLAEETRDVVMRAIHATADFSYAENLRFTPGVVARMRAMLGRGATIITDTNMALAGVSKAAAAKLNVSAVCFMADPDVARAAKARGVTRAQISMERALALPGEKLIACGNAPTFLLPLLAQMPDDVCVIGAPVGFVNVVEVKQRLWASGLPAIVAMGRRGGSGVAAAIVNALLYGIEGVRA